MRDARCTSLSLYQASRKSGVAKQKLEEYLAEKKHEVFIYRYPEIDAEILPIFDIVPMKFGDCEKEVSDYRMKYYEELGVPVPVGQPGTNTGQLAKSEKLHYIWKTRLLKEIRMNELTPIKFEVMKGGYGGNIR